MELFIKILALLSLPIAFYAAYVARGSREIAKRALELNQQIYSDRQSSFSMYFIKGNFYKNLDEDVRIIMLNVTVHNLSDSKTTFTANLNLEYKLADGERRTVSVEHNSKLKELLPSLDIEIFGMNPRFDERHSESKWFCFAEPKNIPDDYTNSKYQLTLKDNKGNDSSVDVYILKSLI